MAIRKQVEEMDDVAEVSSINHGIRGVKTMGISKKALATIGEVVSDELHGVDVKSLLRKMGALKEDAPVVKDIDWHDKAVVARVWKMAQEGNIPDVWKGLKTEELNEKLQQLVKVNRNYERGFDMKPKKEEPKVVKAANFGEAQGTGFKVTDKRRKFVEEVVEEEPMQEEDEFDEAPAVKKDTARDVKKARRKNMDSKAKVVAASEQMKMQMQAMESASALASLSQFKPKEDEDKVFTVLTLETQKGGKSKVIFRGGASKFLRPIKLLFGDGMDIVAADEETVEFMVNIQKQIIDIIKRNQ